MASVHKVGQSVADALVQRSIDAGVNFFNTADAYAGGQSEEMLAKALGSKRKDVVIATKVGFRTGEAIVHQGLSRHHILLAAEDSLRRLGTDYIDVYLLHRQDPYTPIEETLAALDSLVQQGKVRYVGFSNWPAWFAAKAVGLQRENKWAQFRAAEMYYSLVGRDLEHELVPFVHDAGVGILVWSPLAAGFLTGRYTRENPQGNGGRLSGFDIIPFDRERGYDVVARLKVIGDGHGATPAQVALAWLLAKPHVTSVLMGASREDQLVDNLGAVGLQLRPEEVAQLDAMTVPAPIYPNWFNANVFDEKTREALGSKT
jgi:aryl-alcohol dehydrogenase-like predicted oxidoreductase